MSTYNVEDLQKELKNKLNTICIEIDHLTKVKKAIDFFRSDYWANMHEKSSKLSHRFAAEFLSEIFGSRNFMIYDAGIPLYDDGDLLSKLTSEQKCVLEYVDTYDNEATLTISTQEQQEQQGQLVVSSGNFIFQNIGSTVVIPAGPDDGLPESIDPDEDAMKE